jgi:hypothetical protein
MATTHASKNPNLAGYVGRTRKRPDRQPRRPRANQRLLTVSQAEMVSGIPAMTLRDLIARKLLPEVRLPENRRVWIDRRDLDSLIDRGRGTRE